MPVILDLNFTKLLVLAVIALLVFGPERLPAIAAQAGRALRELRRMAEGAKSELQENLGPEFSNFDLADLNPKQFVRKHLVDDISSDGVRLPRIDEANGNTTYSSDRGMAGWPAALATLTPGETPPYDAEAT